ncbi:MAG: hypothetical protein HY512_02245 [Candidatus Aenigmarchaeota archaeon]|nr:hypothetical protein [Candidatus Aenigmarchaeota archaeon]
MTAHVTDLERDVERLRYELEHFDELGAKRKLEEAKRTEAQLREKAEQDEQKRKEEALLRERERLKQQLEAKQDPAGFLTRQVEPLVGRYIEEIIVPQIRRDLGKLELQKYEKRKRELETREYTIEETDEHTVEVRGFFTSRQERRTRTTKTRVRLGVIRYGCEWKARGGGSGGMNACGTTRGGGSGIPYEQAFVLLGDGRKVVVGVVGDHHFNTSTGTHDCLWPQPGQNFHKTYSDVDFAHAIGDLIAIKERIDRFRRAVQNPIECQDDLPYAPPWSEWQPKYRERIKGYKLKVEKEIARRFSLDNLVPCAV